MEGLTLNFTTYDTTNMSILNSSFEATFQFYSESGGGGSVIEYLFSDLDEDRSNYMFCLNSSGQNATLYAFISYSATYHDRREYIISEGIIPMIKLNKNKILRIAVSLVSSILNIIRKEFIRETKKPKKRRNIYEDFNQDPPPGTY